MTKKKNKKGSLIIVFLVLIIVVFGSLYIFNEKFRKETGEKPTELDKTDENPLVYTGSVTLAGNVLINSDMWYDTRSGDGVYDFSNAFKLFKENLKKSNISFYTQQSPVGGKDLGMTKNYNYNSPNDILDEMLSTGFNAISLASYHAFDKGTKGITNEITYLNEKDVIYSGVSTKEEDRLKNSIITKNGITYALLSYTMSTDEKLKDTYSVSVYSEELAKKDIDKVKSSVDVIIVSIDFGNVANSTQVSEKQKSVVDFLVKEGVNVIVGNNSYSIQPIEIIDNTLVCYSLGNLLSGHTRIDSRISAVVDFNISLTKEEGKKKIEFKDINVMFTYSYNKDNSNYKVVPFNKITNEFSSYKTYYEKYKTLLTDGKDYINVYALGDTNGNTEQKS